MLKVFAAGLDPSSVMPTVATMLGYAWPGVQYAPLWRRFVTVCRGMAVAGWRNVCEAVVLLGVEQATALFYLPGSQTPGIATSFRGQLEGFLLFLENS